jgi:hypothetical protein
MNMDIEILRDDLSQIDDVDFVGGVPTEAIASAETELQVSFPPGYKAFLRQFRLRLFGRDHRTGRSAASRCRLADQRTEESIVKSVSSLPNSYLHFPRTVSPMRRGA